MVFGNLRSARPEAPRPPNQYVTSSANSNPAAAPIGAAINSAFDLGHLSLASLAM